MKEVIINNTMNLIEKNYSYPKEKLALIKYGLESIYLTIFKISTLLIISIIFNYKKEFLLFMFTFGLLRLNGFGVHAKKSIHCWITSGIFFIGFPLLVKYFTLNKKLIILLTIPLILLILKYAPADTEKRPLINKNKRLRFKIISVIISLIYLAIIIFTNNLKLMMLLFMSMLLETILILPISYKVLGMKYSNYLNYKRKEERK